MARQPSALRAREMLALLPTLRRGATIRLADLAAALGSTHDHVVELLEDLVFCGVPPFSPDTLIDLDIQADSVTVNSEPPALSRPLRLTRAELRAVLAALETAGVDPEDPLVQKLTEAAGSAGAVDALASTLRAQPEIGAAETYALLADAIETSRKVRLSYWSLGDDPRGRQRVVQPHALVNRTGVWYLTAFCESAGAVRTFRLDRIREATVLDEGFPPPADPQTAVVPDTAGLPV
ncbi:MAG: WYL domain-containing protein, partial [Coriobacteriia bacterium]|nr:WYL domain-containing protein [Coriobacteriia bacterium]